MNFFVSMFETAVLLCLSGYTSMLFFANASLRRNAENIEHLRKEFCQREALTNESIRLINNINAGCYYHYLKQFSCLTQKSLIEKIQEAVNQKINYHMNEREFIYSSLWETNKYVKIRVYCALTGETPDANISLSFSENFYEKTPQQSEVSA